MDVHAEGVPAKFSSVWDWAIRDVDELHEKSLSARIPKVAEYVNCIAQSFGDTHQLVLRAHANEPPTPPDSLALIFARIVEFDRRAVALVKAAPIADWPGTPGCTLAQFSGRSGLDVAISYSTAVFQALLFTFGCGMSGKRFPPYIEEMPLTGEGITNTFRGWPERAHTELRERTIPAEPVWMMRRDGERVWGAVELEYERYVDRLVALGESSKQPPGLATTVRTPDAPQGFVVPARGEITDVRGICDEIVVDRDQQTLTYMGRTARIGGDVSWRAFLALFDASGGVIDLGARFGRRSKDVALDIRRMLVRGGFPELSKRVSAQRGCGHFFRVE